MIYSLPPKVGDTLTATVAPDDAVVTYQWLADGVAISGATKATLSVTENLLGKKISVTVTAEDGEEATSAETKAVTQDKKAEVTIVDIDGLQSDGTGLVGDRLHLSYGSEMGVPELITWYYNETVSKSERADSGTGLSQMLNLATGAGTLNKDGDYYAVITNKDGATYTSNTITLIYDELPAEVASIDIEDDYEGNENITYGAKDYTAVVTVNMKKFYDGKFYVYEDGVVNYNSGNYATMLATDAVTFVNATTSDKMTAKNVLDTNFKGLSDGGYEITNGSKALKYVAPNGETTLMWAVKETNYDGKNFLNRGKSYKVVFDQAGIATDNITAASRKDVEATDSVEAPYVEAPASLVLETAANGQDAVAYFVDADGEKLTWLGAANSNSKWDFEDEECGFDYVSVYGNSEAKTDGAERATTGGTIVKGVWTSDGAIAKDKTIYYAEAKTIAGIYGEESVKLQSDYKTKNLPLASKVVLADDGTTAKVTFNDVIAPATVYVFNVNEAAEAGGFDPDDSSSYRGSATVAVGQGSATVSSVFKKDEVGEVYGAILVPNDTSAYADKKNSPNADNKDTGDDQFMTLKHKPTTLEYTPGAKMTQANTVLSTTGDLEASLKNNVVFTQEYTSTGRTALVVKDQFGVAIVDDTDLSKITDKAATVAASDSGKKYGEKGTATFSFDGDDLTINLSANSGVDSGDGFDITVLGTKITFRAAWEVAGADKPFEAKIGSDKIMSPEMAVTAGAVTVVNEGQLVWALGQSDVTTVHAPATLVTDGAVTIPAGKTVDTVTNWTVNGTLTNKGTIGNLTTGLTNNGTVTNEGTMGTIGALNNNKKMTNSGTIGAVTTLTNKDEFTNSGTMGAITTIDNQGTFVSTGVEGAFTTVTASAANGSEWTFGTVPAGMAGYALGTSSSNIEKVLAAAHTKPVEVNIARAVTTQAAATVNANVTVNNLGAFTLGNTLALNGTFNNYGSFDGASKTITVGNGGVFATEADGTALAGTGDFQIANTDGYKATFKDLTNGTASTVTINAASGATTAVAETALGTNYSRKTGGKSMTLDVDTDKVTIAIVAD